MTTPPPKPPRDDLIGMLKTPGWQLSARQTPVVTGTLEDAARAAHARHQKGEEPGLVAQIEDNMELGLIELQQLWMHLGLPM